MKASDYAGALAYYLAVEANWAQDRKKWIWLSYDGTGAEPAGVA